MIAPKVAPPTPREETLAREIVKARDGGVCVKCLRNGPVTNFDHRKNASQGGQVVASNGQLLCGSGTTGCHGWKTEHPKLALYEGWAVPGYADAALWPAARWFQTGFGTVRLGWCLYGDDGRVQEVTEAEARELMA